MQAPLFDLDIDQIVVIDSGLHPGVLILGDRDHALVDGADEAGDGLRIRGQELARDHHAVGIEVEAIIAELEPFVVLVGILAVQHEVKVARDVEHQRGVDIALDQHRLLQVRRHVGDLDLLALQLVLLREHRQQPRGRRALRAAQRMALEILDGVDAAGLLGDDRKRRLVPDHVDHDRRVLRLGRGVLDDGVDVAEAGIIGARHDARYGGAGALALVDHDIEAFLFEIAVVLGIEERGVGALRLPAERELDRRLLGTRGAGEQGNSQQRGAYSG